MRPFVHISDGARSGPIPIHVHPPIPVHRHQQFRHFPSSENPLHTASVDSGHSGMIRQLPLALGATMLQMPENNHLAHELRNGESRPNACLPLGG